MNIFLTGGAGYIGSATAEALIKAGHSVTVYDSLVTGHREAVPAGAEFIHASLDDSQALAAVLNSKKYDAVMHFAAFIEAGESMKDPGRFFRNNFANSVQLMDAAVQAGVRKIVFSSTAAVYQSSEEPLTEDSPIGPTNVYGHTKLMTEQVLEWYRSIFGMHYAILRYFNACGALPGRGEAHQPESHLIPRVLQIALGQAESATIFGTDYPTPDGTCIRDYIHLGDLVSAHVLALGALEKRDKMIYNVGSGNGFSVREVIEAARKVTGHAIPVVEQPRRAGDSARLVASPTKIKKELGWEPKNTNLQDILSSAWEWHTTHPHGYEK
ncbi:MAG: UDP-glucose 4-epimerase GalE [Anaerolineales bacterium]|jgi:UDP-glucose 4-epimerase|uniref:UDP-glucose 4-epimerase GalE n=1 Tax=Candidatus Villigracilis vicinus TaxID=3140679 RepID=UPI0031364C51|nr:UDP-glucose 4-epimerase GalE [Anaerolineales bacterium]MBK9779364.1 UDP-glucose 4-epimerase GalE [Anaerolineales bacterium]